MHELISKLGSKLEGWGQDLVLMLPNLGGAIAVVVLFWFLASVVGRTIRRLLNRISSHKSLNDLVATVGRFAVRVAGILIALHILELDKAATTFLAGAGIVGLAIGFAFQDLTANFIAGVVLALNRPLKVGDLVKTNGFFGTIEAIEMRSSNLRTLQGPIVRIPNRRIFEEPLVNYNDCPKRRVDLSVGVSYGDDLELARKCAIEAVGALDGIEDEPSLFFEEFGDSSINFVIQFWVPFKKQTDFLEPRSRAIVAIKNAFDKEGITIPFPIRTLDFGIVGGEALKSQLPPREHDPS